MQSKNVVCCLKVTYSHELLLKLKCIWIKCQLQLELCHYPDHNGLLLTPCIHLEKDSSRCDISDSHLMLNYCFSVWLMEIVGMSAPNILFWRTEFVVCKILEIILHHFGHIFGIKWILLPKKSRCFYFSWIPTAVNSNLMRSYDGENLIKSQI